MAVPMLGRMIQEDMLLSYRAVELLSCQYVKGRNAAGADLDPRAVLDALGEAVPLSVALPTLGRMIRERTHRVRQGCLLRNLHSSCHLQAAAARVEVRCPGPCACSGRVAADGE